MQRACALLAPALRTLSGAVFVFSLLSGPVYAEPDAARQAELRYLLRQDCGSCHGMQLKGGLGPSLQAQALKDKPDELLLAAILDGRPDTPMPPWRGLISEADARYLVSVLRAGDKP